MMKKTFLLSAGMAVCFFLSTTTVAFGGIEPSPFVPVRSDLMLFQQKIDVSHGRLAEAKQGADLRGSHEDMMTLLRSLQAKVKALQEKGGQAKGIIVICINMKPKLDSLEVSLRNFKIAIQKGDRMAARGLLNEIRDTVKALETLVARE